SSRRRHTSWPRDWSSDLCSSDLAGRLHCDPSNVTYLGDRLEERGLIRRRIDPSDRRVRMVSLTSAGLRTRNKIVRAATTQSPLRSEERRVGKACRARGGAERYDE